MAKRVQISGTLQPQDLTPQARPVDVYYHPPEKAVTPPPKTNSLLQLAESLQSIQPGLDRYIANRDKQVTAKQKAEAEALAGQLALQNQLDWNSSIQSLRKNSTIRICCLTKKNRWPSNCNYSNRPTPGFGFIMTRRNSVKRRWNLIRVSVPSGPTTRFETVITRRILIAFLTSA